MTTHTKQVRLSSVNDCARSHNHQYTAAILFLCVALLAAILSCIRRKDKHEMKQESEWVSPLLFLVNAGGIAGAAFWVSGMYYADECQDSIYVYK